MFRVLGWIVLGIVVTSVLVNVAAQKDPIVRVLDLIFDSAIAGWILWALVR